MAIMWQCEAMDYQAARTNVIAYPSGFGDTPRTCILFRLHDRPPLPIEDLLRMG